MSPANPANSNVGRTSRLLRRTFLSLAAGGIGAIALKSLMKPPSPIVDAPRHITPLRPIAKRIIYLCQSGAPSQLDLFDYKPGLHALAGTDFPDSVRGNQRLTAFTNNQLQFLIAPSIFKFSQYGKCGHWFSELLPHMSAIADEFCMIRSMNTEAINHDPAITFLQTGSQQAGRPSMGAWLTYGLGSENASLPGYVVLTSIGSNLRDTQPVYDRLWGSGFLPTRFQGVKFQNTGDPVPFLSSPPGLNDDIRRESLDELRELNSMHFKTVGDPEIDTRISQYELAFKMQASVPELTDLSKEPLQTFEMYGPDSKRPGSYAANCILARRLAERNVRFIQLYHLGWDQHGLLPKNIRNQCRDTDQPTAALIKDLKQRSLLDDTLIVWGGEFGRTVYSQGLLTATNYGRDHHPRCFTMLMAGAGVEKGLAYGETDEYGYNIVKNPVHVHDLNATILHLMGIEHTQLTYRFQGRDYRLTDVAGNVVHDICS